MASNGYEIRVGLLGMAKDMLYEGWHQAVDASRHNASLTNSVVVPVPPPSFAELEDLAQKLYGFVGQKTAVTPPARVCTAKSTWDEGHPAEVPLRNPSIPPGVK